MSDDDPRTATQAPSLDPEVYTSDPAIPATADPANPTLRDRLFWALYPVLLPDPGHANEVLDAVLAALAAEPVAVTSSTEPPPGALDPEVAAAAGRLRGWLATLGTREPYPPGGFMVDDVAAVVGTAPYPLAEAATSLAVTCTLGWSNADTGPDNMRLYALDMGNSPRWATPPRVPEAALREAGAQEGDRFLVVRLGDRFTDLPGSNGG